MKERPQRGYAVAKITKILNRRRELDEVAPLRVAVRNHCLECCGYSYKEVELCTAPKCGLWPWRFGKTPKELKKRATGHSFQKGNACTR